MADNFGLKIDDASEKEANKIDMVMERDGELHPIEIKRSINLLSKIIGAFTILDKGSVPRGKGGYFVYATRTFGYQC